MTQRQNALLPPDERGLNELISVALTEWSQVWRATELSMSVTVRFEPRLLRSLGRAALADGQISLHPSLRDASPALLREVLCHEVAHVVAFRRAREAGSRRPRAHGAEWKALLHAAGYEPVVRHSLSSLGKAHARTTKASHW